MVSIACKFADFFMSIQSPNDDFIVQLIHCDEIIAFCLSLLSDNSLRSMYLQNSTIFI
jgi:hypothetical protein